MTSELKPSMVNSSKAERPNYSLRRKMAGSILVAAVLGGGYAVDRGEDFLKNNAHTNTEIKDFGKYEIGSNEVELNKVLKKEGIREDAVTKLTISGERNPTEVAIEMGAKRVYDVANYVIQPQVDNPKANVHTMHAGQVVVVPNDMLELNNGQNR